jgi:sporadic carbohydrate cluster 2OG-Fe(II) oxygenase
MESIHKIVKKSSNPALHAFRSAVIDAISSQTSRFSGDLSDLHLYIDIKQINDIRLLAFQKINEAIPWKKLLVDLCEEELRHELGRDILVQSKINLSIQMPGDKNSILPAHSDCWSADTPFQINLWIPLTDAFDTNSMFILSMEQTLDLTHRVANQEIHSFDFNEIDIKKEQFVKMRFGEILLFNPAVLHGNVENKTDKTRVSLNVRLKAMFAPEPGDRNPDRCFGTYYQILRLSESAKFALCYLKTGALS